LTNYTEKDLHVLEGLEHIRLRPAMYIGSVDIKGIEFLLKSVISVVKALDVFSQNGEITVITSEGFSAESHPKRGKPLFEVLFTVLPVGMANNEVFWLFSTLCLRN